MTLLCRLHKPFGTFKDILFHTVARIVADTYIILGVHIALLCRKLKKLCRLYVVGSCSVAVVIQHA